MVRLLEDFQRHRKLADVVQQPADGQVATQGGGKLELLGEARGEQGDAARVLLGRGIPFGQQLEQGADAGARYAFSAATSSTAVRSPTSGREAPTRARSTGRLPTVASTSSGTTGAAAASRCPARSR